MTAGSLVLSSTPHHTFSRDGVDGKTLLIVDLPTVKSLEGVDLDIGTSEIRLRLSGANAYSSIQLPREVLDADVPTAKFSKRRSRLTLSWMPQRDPVAHGVLDEPTDTSELGWHELTPGAQHGEIDCLSILQAEVEHRLKHCTVERFRCVREMGGASVMLNDFTVVGSASLNADSCCFRISVSFSWEVEDGIGGLLGASGTGIADLTESTTAPCVTIKASCTANPSAREACDWMRRVGSGTVAACLNATALAQAVIGEATKQKMVQPVVPVLDVLPRVVLKIGQERCLTQWAATWLSERLGGMQLRLFGGLAIAEIQAPRVEGMASVVGGCRACWDLRIRCEWRVLQSKAAVAEGALSVSQFTSEKKAKVALVEFDSSPGIRCSGQFLAALRKDGVASVRDVLGQLENEFIRQT